MASMPLARLLLAILVLCIDASLALAAPARPLAKNVIATLPAGADSRAVAVNATTNRIYVANEFSDDVTIIDGATNAVSTVKVGPRPQYIAVSAATNRVFVSNAGDATLSVIDAATLTVKTLAIGGAGPIVVNDRRNQVYIARMGTADEVTVLDGAALTWYTAATDSYSPVDLAVDEAADRLYVANYATGDVRIVDLTSTSDFPPTVSIGVWSHPTNLALNVNAHRLFVIGEDSRGPITVIDTTTRQGTSFAPAGHAQGPRALVVNPATNKAYAAFANEVVVVDGNSNTLAFLPMPTPVALAVDSGTNRIYAPNAGGSVTVIDGATNALSSLSVATGARAVAVNASTHRVYVAGSGQVTVIDGTAPLSGPTPPVLAPVNAQGLWWASPPGSESGWGVHLTQQGDVLFGTWFTYDTDGSGLWLVMSNGAKTGANSWAGTLYRTTGPAFGGATFDPAKVVRTEVGSATFTFTDANNGVLSATVNGVPVSKRITRQLFSAPAPTCEANGPSGALPNYQDLWWKAPAGSESGWGVNIAHQGNILFVTWFTYAADGRGMWLVGSNVQKTGNATYSGTLYRSIGPAFNANPWDPSKVSLAAAGQVTLTFSDAANGTMAYTVDGITQSKAITRQLYASPPTVCR
jgi:YVTN family beta-propeller protein